MNVRRLGIGVLAALALVSLATACGGDDDGDAPAPATTAAGATTPAGATGTATRTSTASTPAATATATGTAGGAETLRRAVSLEKDATYSITYEVTFVEGGTTTKGTYVVNQKPPKRAATLTFDDGTIALIFDGQNSWVCNGDGKDGICLRDDRPDQPDLLPSGSPNEVVKDITDRIDDTRAREVGRRTVAGVEARCWEITNPSGNGTLCLSANGVLLLNEGTFEGISSRFVATRISGEVDDRAFEPPYEELGGR